ncbi:hypothetical protein [Chitinophaga filiformis]|uniref:Uncharacterized protein n=1 Tax=Chitinophaga filiformis TaxID=104663 RepID=A0ABY4I8A1_CHIFI|nr:hypothetical protein [Chitinophaga filiformis]UPK72318.1 hypothetical protein MYF79_13570 [Chitinophaga filiformis]
MKISKHLSISGSNIGRRLQHAEGKPIDKLPDIRMVITDYYRGAINDVIYMIIRNVDHVMVSILSAEGMEIETGAAMNSSGVWSYRTVTANPAFPGGKVVVRAGNIRGDHVEMGVGVF